MSKQPSPPKSSPEKGPDSQLDPIMHLMASNGVTYKRLLEWWKSQADDVLFKFNLNLSYSHAGWPTITIGPDRLTNLPPPDVFVLGFCYGTGTDWLARREYLSPRLTLNTTLPFVTLCIHTPWSGEADVPVVPYIQVSDARWLATTRVRDES